MKLSLGVKYKDVQVSQFSVSSAVRWLKGQGVNVAL